MIRAALAVVKDAAGSDGDGEDGGADGRHGPGKGHGHGPDRDKRSRIPPLPLLHRRRRSLTNLRGSSRALLRRGRDALRHPPPPPASLAEATPSPLASSDPVGPAVVDAVIASAPSDADSPEPTGVVADASLPPCRGSSVAATLKTRDALRRPHLMVCLLLGLCCPWTHDHSRGQAWICPATTAIFPFCRGLHASRTTGRALPAPGRSLPCQDASPHRRSPCRDADPA
ncbi:hypothetical protein ZWY2020_000805 [Hordeum vulgare]|nr:hypothetical protein ZWY2020_000805 [Hordeum vulgare]